MSKTLDDATDAFNERPCRDTALELLAVAVEYTRDEMLTAESLSATFDKVIGFVASPEELSRKCAKLCIAEISEGWGELISAGRGQSRMPDSLNTDEDWAKLIMWLQANGMRIIEEAKAEKQIAPIIEKFLRS